MANTSSAKKAVRQITRRTAVNKARRSNMRTSLRKVEEAIASGDKNAAQAALACRRADRCPHGAARHSSPPRRFAEGVAPRQARGRHGRVDQQRPRFTRRLTTRPLDGRTIPEQMGRADMRALFHSARAKPAPSAPRHSRHAISRFGERLFTQRPAMCGPAATRLRPKGSERPLQARMFQLLDTAISIA